MKVVPHPPDGQDGLEEESATVVNLVEQIVFVNIFAVLYIRAKSART